MTVATASEAGVLLRAEDVEVRFGPLRALDGVSLSVQPGELVALAGENGAGKSTLVRCIAGDIEPARGRILVGGRPVVCHPATMARRGVAVVWQDLALCDNLDVAANLLLGRETPRLVRSATKMQVAARELLRDLEIPLRDVTQSVQSLSGGQRQLLAVARALRDHPQLLILDEPTAALGVVETAQVEALISRLRAQGTTIVLVSHDTDQMFRVATRIVVLRHGRVVGDVDPDETHPDEVVALVAGQQVDGSARRQLDRLQSLVGRLASAEPSSSVPLILSALGAALGTAQLALHIVDGDTLRAATSVGLPPAFRGAWETLPVGPDGGPVGLAAAGEAIVIDSDVGTSRAWGRWKDLAATAHVGSSWAMPITGSRGLIGVLTVLQRQPGCPLRAELDLVAMYAGHAASALEREQLLSEVTVRNRLLETIREVLQRLAGPGSSELGLRLAVQALQLGLGAKEIGLLTWNPSDGPPLCRAHAGRPGAAPSAELVASATALRNERPSGQALAVTGEGGSTLAVAFDAPGGVSLLVAVWDGDHPDDATALVEDAANSLRLALEREEAERAHQETTALRRSQELQRLFLSRLSHELRTPLTAIRGYASSLMQPDVTWDASSQERFLSRIAAESSRLGRLVDDLLDFSAIEASVLRLHPDWCDLSLVLDAAVACLSPGAATGVEVRCPADLPVIWADHDRLEQVFVNLLDNAVRHNPPGTAIHLEAAEAAGEVVVTVTDEGTGVPPGLLSTAPGAARPRRTATSGAGLGLSIAAGIVEAHGGRLRLEPMAQGTRFSVQLPVERTAPADIEPVDVDLAVPRHA